MYFRPCPGASDIFLFQTSIPFIMLHFFYILLCFPYLLFHLWYFMYLYILLYLFFDWYSTNDASCVSLYSYGIFPTSIPLMFHEFLSIIISMVQLLFHLWCFVYLSIYKYVFYLTFILLKILYVSSYVIHSYVFSYFSDTIWTHLPRTHFPQIFRIIVHYSQFYGLIKIFTW